MNVEDLLKSKVAQNDARNRQALEAARRYCGPGASVGVLIPTGDNFPQAHPDVVEFNRKLEIRPCSEEETLNQTEADYLVWLRKMRPQWIGVKCITLNLGDKCKFTPDFWALDAEGLRAIDTKGKHVWEDSIIKMKMAARLFPFIRFVKAQRIKRGQPWKHHEYKP